MLWSSVLKKGTPLTLNPPTHLQITGVTLKEGNGTFRVLVTYFDIAKEDDVTVPFAVVSTNKPNFKSNIVFEEGQEVTLSVEGDCTISLLGFFIIENDDESFQFEDEDDENLMDSFITDGDGEEDVEEEKDDEMAVEEPTKGKKDYIAPLKDNSTPAPKPQKKIQPVKVEQPKKQEKKQENKQANKQENKPVEKKQEVAQQQSKFTLSGGVEVEILKPGSGNVAARNRRVSVKYTGRLAKNQKVFDSGTFAFKLGAGEVIKGWDLGVLGMKVGEKRKLTIPPALAYGNKGAGKDIPGGSTLIFDVELLKC